MREAGDDGFRPHEPGLLQVLVTPRIALDGEQAGFSRLGVARLVDLDHDDFVPVGAQDLAHRSADASVPAHDDVIGCGLDHGFLSLLATTSRRDGCKDGIRDLREKVEGGSDTDQDQADRDQTARGREALPGLAEPDGREGDDHLVEGVDRREILDQHVRHRRRHGDGEERADADDEPPREKAAIVGVAVG